METLIEGLVASKQDEIGNKFGGTFSQSFDLGKMKCVAENRCVDFYKVKGVDRVDSINHGDGSVKGISLFVELTDGVVNKPVGEGIHDVKNCLSYENQVMDDAGQEEFGVNVGDLVWAIVRKKQKQFWWPGTVCDAANAPIEAANEPSREDDILVRCFGNGNFVWCSSYEVKPFVGHFDPLPNQSAAKKYLNALEIAVTELGHRVKTEFSCSCLSMVKKEKTAHFGDISVARFEPAMFLDYIKDLGKSNSMPNKVDYVVKQSCLSAFYRSLGHLQIPMNELQPANRTPLKIKTEEEIGYFGDDPNGQSKCVLDHQILQETLPKKDKYVIPPALGNHSNHGPLFLDFQNVGSFNLDAQSFSNMRTEWPANQYTVFNYGILPSSRPPPWNADIRTLPNVNHMAGLYQAPVFNFPHEFGYTTPYFTANHGEPQAGLTSAGLTHVLQKIGRKRKNIDLQANPGSTMDWQPNPASTIDCQANSGSYIYPHLPQVGLVPTGMSHNWRNMKNIDLQANPDSTIDLQANPSSTMDLQVNQGSAIIPNLNENITGLKKRKRVERNKEIGVPCVNLSYKKVQQNNLELKGTAFLLKFSPDCPLPSIQDLNSVFSKFGELIESETQVLNENLSGQVVFLDSSSAGGAFWGLQNDKPLGPVLVNYKIQHLAGSESMVPFKTPIKSPSVDSKAIIGSTMVPDLSTNSTEVQILKLSKTMEEIRLPSNDTYLSYNKVHQGNEEATGTALLLKFSPIYPLPSFRDLNLIFCKYGELNESETQVSGQNFTGQVVFVNPSAAGDAIHRLETERPFGPALLSYRVHHLYSVQYAVRAKCPVNISLELKPPQDLVVLKKNLDMMNLMLEKSGDSLSPEMRGRLESEIKGLMNKVSALDGSSSSYL